MGLPLSSFWISLLTVTRPISKPESAADWRIASISFGVSTPILTFRSTLVRKSYTVLRGRWWHEPVMLFWTPPTPAEMTFCMALKSTAMVVVIHGQPPELLSQYWWKEREGGLLSGSLPVICQIKFFASLLNPLPLWALTSLTAMRTVAVIIEKRMLVVLLLRIGEDDMMAWVRCKTPERSQFLGARKVGEWCLPKKKFREMVQKVDKGHVIYVSSEILFLHSWIPRPTNLMKECEPLWSFLRIS